jgi:hypothetical protein
LGTGDIEIRNVCCGRFDVSLVVLLLQSWRPLGGRHHAGLDLASAGTCGSSEQIGVISFMRRPSTKELDAKILKLYYTGHRLLAEGIRWRLHLPNIWAVYNALKRKKQRQEHSK